MTGPSNDIEVKAPNHFVQVRTVWGVVVYRFASSLQGPTEWDPNAIQIVHILCPHTPMPSSPTSTTTRGIGHQQPYCTHCWTCAG